MTRRVFPPGRQQRHQEDPHAAGALLQHRAGRCIHHQPDLQPRLHGSSRVEAGRAAGRRARQVCGARAVPLCQLMIVLTITWLPHLLAARSYSIHLFVGTCAKCAQMRWLNVLSQTVLQRVLNGSDGSCLARTKQVSRWSRCRLLLPRCRWTRRSRTSRAP